MRQSCQNLPGLNFGIIRLRKNITARRVDSGHRIEYLEPDEILEPEPSPRIRVEVMHRAYQPRQRQQTIPPWAIAILIIGMLCWISPFGLVIAMFMIGAFVTAYPTIAIAFAMVLVLFIGIAVRERLVGRPF